MAAIRSKLARRLAAVEHQIDQSGGQILDVARDLAARRRAIGDVRDMLNQMRRRVWARLGELEEQVAELRREQGRRVAESSALDQRVDALAGNIEGLAELGDRVERLAADRDSAVEDQRALREIVAALHCTVTLLLGPTQGSHSRLVAPGDLARLEQELDFLGAGAVGPVLSRAFRCLVCLEAEGVATCDGMTLGVIATLAAVQLLDAPCGDVLEVGTISGVEAVGVARELSVGGLDSHLTLVPAVESRSSSLLLDYLERWHVPATSYRVIDLESAEQADVVVSDRKYGVVLVNGRHTGFELSGWLRFAEKVAAPGAMLIIDGVDDPTSPAVAPALDQQLAESPRLTCLGTAASRAFLRVGAAGEPQP